MSDTELEFGPYRGFYGKADWDPGEARWVGRVTNSDAPIGFGAEKQAGLEQDFRKAIDAFLGLMAEMRGET